MEIRIDDLTGEPIYQLLNEHLQDMYAVSPPESVHALDTDRLRAPEITFWSIWQGDALAGCGALKMLNSHEAELKSMRTSQDFRRMGVASRLLSHLLSEAKARGVTQLYLETGTVPFFAPAIALYKAFGFEECGPFADYSLDPFSLFMTKAIN